MEALGFERRQETILSVIVEDVQKTSEIEGENLDAGQVRSSVALRLGIDAAGLPRASRKVDGVVEMMLDATQNYDRPLTADRLFGWHVSLFPLGPAGLSTIRVGSWRDDALGPMQVVSGPIGKERVHYQAPSASRLEDEMISLLNWFETANALDPILKAAIAHLWFVAIHPLDDGNGRIGRAIMDLALARSDRTSQRFYSVTSEIHKLKHEYYDVLERTQKASLDITSWIQWFLICLDRALTEAEGVLVLVRSKTAFWTRHSQIALNERQRLVLNRLLDGLEGKLTSSKWAKLAKCSQDTAHRDISDLVQKQILVQDEAGGRSTSYSLAITET